VLPAFWPVIESQDEDWKHLQRTFSYSFRNNPFEFHNGGRWPMITGFYVAALAKRGKLEQAERFLQGIHGANAMESDGEAWSFPEFIHGKELTPCGTLHQGWSAGAAIIGEHALRGELLFRIEDHD
jgi:glycogen debranching enzyme